MEPWHVLLLAVVLVLMQRATAVLVAGCVRRWFPELQQLPPTAQRETLRAARPWLRVRSDHVLIQILALVPVLVLGTLTLVVYRGAPTVVVVGVFFALCYPTLAVANYFLARERMSHHIRETLIQHRQAVCVACGYSLKGLEVPRCPECGRAFDMEVLNPTRFRAFPEPVVRDVQYDDDTLRDAFLAFWRRRYLWPSLPAMAVFAVGTVVLIAVGHTAWYVGVCGTLAVYTGLSPLMARRALLHHTASIWAKEESRAGVITFGPDRLEIATALARRYIPWDQIESVQRTPRAWLLFRTPLDMAVVPVSALADGVGDRLAAQLDHGPCSGTATLKPHEDNHATTAALAESPDPVERL